MMMTITNSERDWIVKMFSEFQRNELRVMARGFKSTCVAPGYMTREGMLLRFIEEPSLLDGLDVDAQSLRDKIKGLNIVQITKLANYLMAIVKQN